MTPDRLTLVVTLAIIAQIVCFDIWTLIMRGYATTISWSMFKLAQGYPIIGVAVGIVVGHLFWPNHAAGGQP